MSKIQDAIKRLSGRGARGYACSVKVGEPHRVGGAGGATPMACSFCSRMISGMCGPGGPGTACQLCATAIRDDSGPLGILLRETWGDALQRAWRDEA